MTEPKTFISQQVVAADGSLLISVDGTDFGGHGGEIWWLRYDPATKQFSIERSGGIAWGGTWHSEHTWEEGLLLLSAEARARALRERENLNNREVTP